MDQNPANQPKPPVSFLSALVSNLNVHPPDPFLDPSKFKRALKPPPGLVKKKPAKPAPKRNVTRSTPNRSSRGRGARRPSVRRPVSTRPRINWHKQLRIRERTIKKANRVTKHLTRDTVPSKASRKRSRSVGLSVSSRFNGRSMRGGFTASRSMRGFTENGSATYLASGNPCLDFFFHIVPDTPADSLVERLQLAWDHDPLRALKLVCNLRGVRGTGKSDKEGFYTAVIWLHNHHPKTLAANLGPLADFGYFKDLPEILYRLLEGEDVRELAKKERQANRSTLSKRQRHNRNKRLRKEEAMRQKKKKKTSDEPPKQLSREEKKMVRAKKVIERFDRDPDFKFLHDRVSDVFSERLRSDLKKLNAGELFEIGLAAKWCPSLDSSYDQFLMLCEAIGKKVFPREEYGEYEGVEEAHYAYRVRDRLRKEVLVPLRKALELPEVYMGASDWGSLPYKRVASVAMKNYKEKFLQHDEERFKEYLGDVKDGKAKIAAGALLPHELIAELNHYDSDEDKDEVVELQWKQMVADVAKKGKLSNCLAICDVSGSMSGIPMEVSVALGVLVSELSEEPWKGKLITFSQTPQLQTVEGDTLKEKTNFVRRMDWGMNTDFQKVFDLILDVAVRGRLRPDQMIKKLFVFSDMEFDQASGAIPQSYYYYGGNFGHAPANPWETDYEMIVRKFRNHGYGDCVPEIVFWNLRDSSATPVKATQNGVALVSGFSKNLLTLFLGDENVPISPEGIMDAAISGEEYQKLVVID